MTDTSPGICRLHDGVEQITTDMRCPTHPLWEPMHYIPAAGWFECHSGWPGSGNSREGLTPCLRIIVPGPGVYNLPEAAYHADPVPGGSLSSTGARKLLDTCPAKFQHWQTSEGETKQAWDEGSAAHKKVLGAGPELVKVPGTGKSGVDAWQNDKDKNRVLEVRAAGGIPLKPRQWDMVHGMAAALARHKLAAALLDPTAGKAEQTIVWQDQQTGVMCRALIDLLRHPSPSGVFIIPDYKTCECAHPDKVARSVSDWGYHIQGWWYQQACKAAGRGPDVRFALVAQEKSAPYLVSVCFPDAESIQAGGLLARDAINQYAECSESGVWPGYPEQGVPVSLSPWELAKAGVGEW